MSYHDHEKECISCEGHNFRQKIVSEVKRNQSAEYNNLHKRYKYQDPLLHIPPTLWYEEKAVQIASLWQFSHVVAVVVP